MSKEWMVNAPNGSHVNVAGYGRFNHGDRVRIEKLAKNFPHIFMEIFIKEEPKEVFAPVPVLIEEPAIIEMVIDESPQIQVTEQMIAEVEITKEDVMAETFADEIAAKVDAEIIENVIAIATEKNAAEKKSGKRGKNKNK